MGQQQSQAAPNPDDPNPHAAWWCKLLARVAGIIGGGMALVMGVWACISVHPICIGAGILQMLLAAIVLILEAPCCFQFVEVAKPVVKFAENRPFLHKAILYCVASIFPIAMCFGMSTLFGAGLIFAAGVLYGLMALGKKADRETMMQRAGQPETAQPPPASAVSDDSKVNLIDNENDPYLQR